MTQEGTLRDWAVQVKLLNKAFAHREAELKAELAMQSQGATVALNAAAAKITDIESQLLVSRAELMQLHQAATEQDVRLRDAAVEEARASAEQVSNSEFLSQQLAQQLAVLKSHVQALESELDAARALHESAVAHAAEREHELRAAQATSEHAVSAAEARAAQIEARCQSLTNQIAAAAQRERSARQALDEAHKALAAGEARSLAGKRLSWKRYRHWSFRRSRFAPSTPINSGLPTWPCALRRSDTTAILRCCKVRCKNSKRSQIVWQPSVKPHWPSWACCKKRTISSRPSRQRGSAS